MLRAACWLINGSSGGLEPNRAPIGVFLAGGFGRVVKARNRFDNRVYAVKKVLMERHAKSGPDRQATNSSDKMLREVITLSRLVHHLGPTRILNRSRHGITLLGPSAEENFERRVRTEVRARSDLWNRVSG